MSVSYKANCFVVGLDFDGVLALGVKTKIKYARKWFGLRLGLEETKKDGFEALAKRKGRAGLNYRSLMDPVNEKHIMEYQVPFLCRHYLKKLFIQGFRFVIITSRNAHDYPYAVQFIDWHFKGVIKYVHNTGKDDKGGFVEKLRPRVYLDDDIKKLLLLKNYPIELCYFRQPENYAVDLPFHLSDRISEVQSFRQFCSFLMKLKQSHEAVCWKEGIKNDMYHQAEIYEACHRLSHSSLKEVLRDYEKAA